MLQWLPLTPLSPCLLHHIVMVCKGIMLMA